MMSKLEFIPVFCGELPVCSLHTICCLWLDPRNLLDGLDIFCLVRIHAISAGLA
jgi:hypothetical protein